MACFFELKKLKQFIINNIFNLLLYLTKTLQFQIHFIIYTCYIVSLILIHY